MTKNKKIEAKMVLQSRWFKHREYTQVEDNYLRERQDHPNASVVEVMLRALDDEWRVD